MDGRIALFDMDGTLFDYDGQLNADLQKLCSPEEVLPKNLYDWPNNPSWLNARIELIRRQPGWWRNLPRLEIGWQILRACQEIGFCCHILTKGPRSKSVAWMEKLDCINDHLGEEFPVNIVNGGADDGKDKSNNYGRLLVDDFPPFVEGWLKNRKRGLGVMPAGPTNVNFTHSDVLRYRGPEDMPELRRLLQAVYDRSPKQHWRDYLFQQERERNLKEVRAALMAAVKQPQESSTIEVGNQEVVRVAPPYVR